MVMLTDSGARMDVMGTMDRLFRDTPGEVSGDGISREKRKSLETTLRNSTAYAKFLMEQRGLYPVDNRRTEYMRVIPIEPEGDSLEGGSTNGNRMDINSYPIPGTKYYRQFQKWLDGRKGAFGRYMRGEFGTPEKANESVRYTITHEAGHNATQLRKMRAKNGKVIKPFVERLFNGLKRYYIERLKKNDKWISGFLASMSFRPLAEGMNDVFSMNARYAMTANEIIRDRSNKPDAYSWYAVGSADFCARHGLDPGEEGAHFYSRGDLLDKYIQQHPARIRIPASYFN